MLLVIIILLIVGYYAMNPSMIYIGEDKEKYRRSCVGIQLRPRKDLASKQWREPDVKKADRKLRGGDDV
jgi:hypothetical protein